MPGRGHTQGAKKATNIRGLALRSKGQADDTSIAIADIPTFMDKMGEPLSKEDIKVCIHCRAERAPSCPPHISGETVVRLGVCV